MTSLNGYFYAPDSDRPTWRIVDSGCVPNPGIKNVARLAKALGLPTAELCKGVDA